MSPFEGEIGPGPSVKGGVTRTEVFGNCTEDKPLIGPRHGNDTYSTFLVFFVYFNGHCINQTLLNGECRSLLSLVAVSSIFK